MQMVAITPLYVPATHDVQRVAPYAPFHCPAAQAIQVLSEEAAITVLYRPGVHGIQAELDEAAVKLFHVPAWQALQTVA